MITITLNHDTNLPQILQIHATEKSMLSLKNKKFYKADWKLFYFNDCLTYWQETLHFYKASQNML